MKVAIAAIVAFTVVAFVVIFMFSCGGPTKKNAKPAEPPERLAELLGKEELYKSLIPAVQDEFGFVESNKCDSVLFSGLTGIAIDVDLTAAMGKPGQWFRTPAKNCFDNQLANEENANNPDWEKLEPSSKSDISKEMLLGVLWWAVYNNRPEVIEDVLIYGRGNFWEMGRGLKSRTVMTPALQGLYAQSLAHLTGKKYEPEIYYQPIYTPGNTGFEAHVDIQAGLLYGKVNKGYSEAVISKFKEQYMRQPANPLFALAFHMVYTGDLSEAVNLWANDGTWPDDRLPDYRDNCEPWPVERDMPWDPCTEDKSHFGKTFSGGDLLQGVKLIKDFYGVKN